VSAQYVTLILDGTAATGALADDGQAVIVPSVTQLPDPADEMLVWPIPVTRSFGGSQRPQVQLLPNDLYGPQQESGLPGWTYDISFPGVPGDPEPFSFYLLSTNGSTQYLSALAEVPAAQPGQQYVPALGGSALLGPVAPSASALADGASVAVDTGLGNVFEWTLGGSGHTLAAPSGLFAAKTGDLLYFDILYSGSYVPLFASVAGGYAFGTDGEPDWTSEAGALDLIAFRYSSLKGIWTCQGWKPGF
jgi:hypothetical protein